MSKYFDFVSVGGFFIGYWMINLILWAIVGMDYWQVDLVGGIVGPLVWGLIAKKLFGGRHVQ